MSARDASNEGAPRLAPAGLFADGTVRTYGIHREGELYVETYEVRDRDCEGGRIRSTSRTGRTWPATAAGWRAAVRENRRLNCDEVVCEIGGPR